MERKVPYGRFSPALKARKAHSTEVTANFRVVCILEYGQEKKVMLPVTREILVKELSGLCESCVHVEGCTYRRHAARVVMQCALYSRNTAKNREDAGEAKGLCVNCKKRPHCHLPKEETGVWHCEEYE